MREWGIPLSEVAAYAYYLPPEAATPWIYEDDQERAKAAHDEALTVTPQLSRQEMDRRLGIPRL